MIKVVPSFLIPVLLVSVNLDCDSDFLELVNEGINLAKSANYDIIEAITINKPQIDVRYFIGKGRMLQLKELCKTKQLACIIVNHNLTSIQERNLESELQVKVIDRTRLILDIFASRVTTNEGKLQVELAVLTHQLSRLVKRWSHLERQRGGIGLRGGPGETQIELDKRMIGERIKSLKQRLLSAVKQRYIRRVSRVKNNIFSLSLVGYTNCGKTTLFNLLTKQNNYVEDRLFATLETTSRRLFLSPALQVVVSDTVGFIRDLPHTLVAAFRATLEETINARLLLHVVDYVQVLRKKQIEDVNKVLIEINANFIPQLVIFNKIDLQEGMVPKIEYNHEKEPIAVYISAVNNWGIDLLRQALIEKISWIRSNSETDTHQEAVYEPWQL